MLPRLEAEQSILEAERLAIGFGRLAPKDARDVLSRWQRATGAARIVKAAKATPQVLAGFGIGLVVTDGR